MVAVGGDGHGAEVAVVLQEGALWVALVREMEEEEEEEEAEDESTLAVCEF